MLLEELLSNIDEGILNEDVKKSISDAFETAVSSKIDEAFEVKVAEKALELVEAKEVEYKKLIAENEEKTLAEANEFKETLLNTMDSYFKQFVDENVKDNIDSMQADIENVKAKAIVETFEKLGVEVKTEQIDENIKAREESLAEYKDKIDSLIKENEALKKSISDAEKKSICEKAIEGLSVLQQEKFTSLVEALGEISDMEVYNKKVALVVEAVSDRKEESKVIVETVKPTVKKSVEFTKKYL